MNEPARGAATLTTLGTALVGTWLLLILLVVVPARDPASTGIWAVVAAVTIASAVTTGLTLDAARRGPALRWVTLATSIAALAVGAVLVWTMLTATGPVEEYVLFIGGWLVAHAAASLVLVTRTGDRAPGTGRS